MSAEPTPASQSGRSPNLAFGLLITAMVTVVGISYVTAIGQLTPVDGLATPWFVTGLCYLLADRFVVHVPKGRETHNVTLTEIPLAIGLISLGPGVHIALRTVVGAFALSTRGIAPRKIAFNLATGALELVAAIAIHRLVLSSNSPLGPWGWIAIGAAALAAHLVSAHAVGFAIWLSERTWDRSDYISMLLFGAAASTANASLGVVTVIVAKANIGGLVALAIVGATVLAAYRSFSTMRRQHDSLHRLYSIIEQFEQASDDLDDIARIAVTGAANALFADRSRLVVVEHDRPVIELGHGRDLDQWWIGAGPVPACTTLATSHDWRPWLRRHGLSSAMLVSAPCGSNRTAYLMVADRINATTDFNANDLRFLEALAGHTGIELEKSFLIDDLRHETSVRTRQALIDPRTGLPNRRSCEEHLAANSAQPLAVLAVTSQRWRHVHSTLGFAIAEQFIGALAQRLERVGESAGYVCRLDDATFALTLVDADASIVEATLQQIIDATDDPISVLDLLLSLDIRIGAASTFDGNPALDLLHNAVSAADRAGNSESKVAYYDRAEHDVASRRLVMADELRRAIVGGDIVAWYQPKVNLATSEIVSFEALSRWTSSRFGSVPPDEFIAVAELGGLLYDLTMAVLDQAIANCSSWNAAGYHCGVAVNVSPHSLLNDGLPEFVARCLQRHGLLPSLLTLEITEGTFIDDQDAVVERLSLFRTMGVRLSIDDFGSGYSSLSYLGALPVHEIKLDRSFLREMPGNANSRRIIAAIIDLAHRLDLEVVVEGVESAEVSAMLRDDQCDLIQGYLISRPVPAPDVDAILVDRGRRATRLTTHHA
jgi:EAL domain-containing protein (putative c-di-GMP-specific phosphodiesterase class I)/GGDEF domain-containing protein